MGPKCSSTIEQHKDKVIALAFMNVLSPLEFFFSKKIVLSKNKKKFQDY
jgi:hypothetical protein